MMLEEKLEESQFTLVVISNNSLCNEGNYVLFSEAGKYYHLTLMCLGEILRAHTHR